MSKIIDLTIVRADRGPAVTRFTLEARHVRGATFLWDFAIDDREVETPATGAIAVVLPSRQDVADALRRVADIYDPQPRRRRAKVTARAKRGRRP
jgi:hypothetical protein